MVFVERGARPSFVAVAGILAGHVPAFGLEPARYGLEARAPQSDPRNPRHPRSNLIDF